MSFFHAWASLCFFYSRAATTGGIQAPRTNTLVTFAFPAFHLPSSLWMCNVRAACISVITWCKSFLLRSMIKSTMFARISSRCWESSLTTFSLLYCKYQRQREFPHKQVDHESECLGIQFLLPHLLLRLTCVSLDVRPPSSDLLGMTTELTWKRVSNKKEAVCAILLCKASESVKHPDVEPWRLRLLASQEGPVQDLRLQSRGCVMSVVCRELLCLPTSPHLAIAFALCQFVIKAQNCLVLMRTHIKIVGCRVRYLSTRTSCVFHSARRSPGRLSYFINVCPVNGFEMLPHFVKYFAACELTIQTLTDEQHMILLNDKTSFITNSLFQIVLHKNKHRHFLRMCSVKWKTLRCHQRQLKLKDVFAHSNQAIIQVMNYGSSVLHEGDNTFWQLKTLQKKRHTRYKETGTSSKKFREKLEESQTWAKCSDDRQSRKTVLKYQDQHRKQWLSVIHDKDYYEKVKKEVTYCRRCQNQQISSVLHYHRQAAHLWAVYYRRHQSREIDLTNNDRKTEGHTHLENCVIQKAANSGVKHEGQIDLAFSSQIAKLLLLTPTCGLPQKQTTQMYTDHQLNGNTKITNKMQHGASRTNMTHNNQRMTKQINVTHTVSQVKTEDATREYKKKHTIINVSLDENRGESLPARSSEAWGAIGQKKVKRRSTSCGHREHQRGINGDCSYGDLHAVETAGLHLRHCYTAGQVGDAESATIAHGTSSSERNNTSPISKQKQPNDHRVGCSQSRTDCPRTCLRCEPTPSVLIQLTLCSLLFCAPFAVSSNVVVGVYIQNRESPQALEFFNRTLDVMLRVVKKMLPNKTFIVEKIFESCSSVDTLDEFINMNERQTNPVDVFIGKFQNTRRLFQ